MSLISQISKSLKVSSGGVFALAAQAAMIPASAAILLKHVELNDLGGCGETLREFAHVQGQAFGCFTSMLSFMIVFRSSFAYTRYDSGFDLLTQMKGNCLDAASGLLAFTHGSSAPPAEVVAFMRRISILVSCMQAKAITTMRGAELRQQSLNSLRILSFNELDQRTRLIVSKESSPILVFNWIQRCIMEAVAKKILVAQPPIVGRTIAELSRVLMAMEKAMELMHIPFPAPYEKTVVVLLIIQGCFCPIASLGWSDQYSAIFVLSFIIVFINWALYQIAVLLEEPFGDDEFDIDCMGVQDSLNKNLHLLLSSEATHLPTTTFALDVSKDHPLEPPAIVSMAEELHASDSDSEIDESYDEEYTASQTMRLAAGR